MMTMASEWIKLTDHELNEAVYVNLANARQIRPALGGGSAIWFLGGVGRDGMVQVKESPEKVLVQFEEAFRAARTGMS
jgi:hypothetical protein